MGTQSDHFGASVSTAGDVNGDGHDDVIVGAFYFTNGESLEGGAFVYLGSATGLSASPAWMADSDQSLAVFGDPVSAAGDVNADGYGDVIVGAPSFDNGETNEGRAYVYLGSAAGLSSSPAWTAESDQADSGFGGSVSAGDVNGDGYSDVIVGAAGFNNGQNNEGRVYVYLGSTAGLSTSPAWTAESDQANAGFGTVSAGDVNGDGYDDVLVGAGGFDGDQTDEGRVYAYLGSATGPATSPAWTVESDQTGCGFGVVSAGDLNGDGYDDVLVGAPGFDGGQTDEGRVYAYLASATGPATSPAWTAESDSRNEWFGTSVAAGDVNGDGYDDVISAAWQFGDSNQGRAFVYLGSAQGPSTGPGWLAEGDRVSAAFGWSVSNAGDVNGDGYDDVLVGAPDYDADEGYPLTYDGAAFAYLGSAGFSSTLAFVGDGINVDEIELVNAVIGSPWSAPVDLRHPHGTGGPLSLKIRTTTTNGPNFISPVGGRLTEVLITGTHLAAITGSHNGGSGDIAPQTIPNQPALVGLAWAAQYTVAGGGYADLSQAVHGVVESCP